MKQLRRKRLQGQQTLIRIAIDMRKQRASLISLAALWCGLREHELYPMLVARFDRELGRKETHKHPPWGGGESYWRRIKLAHAAMSNVQKLLDKPATVIRVWRQFAEHLHTDDRRAD